MKLPKEQHDAFVSQAVPIADLMNAPNGLAPAYADMFKSADMILGIDIDRLDKPDECWTVFHGRGVLQDIRHEGRTQNIKIMAVSYSQRTTQLEALIACCQVHRGGCDYGRSSGRHLKDK